MVKEVAVTSINGLSESLEDYLETIFRLMQEKQGARGKDISKRLNVNRSSVTGALRALAQKGLVNYAPYDIITLTDEGKTAAIDIVRRHEVLRDFFVKVLAIDAEQADEAACKMEHAISRTVLERFVQFVEFVETCPRGGDKWIRGFSYYCQNGAGSENCEKCISLCLDEVKKAKMQHEQNGETSISMDNLKIAQRAKIVKISGRSSVNKRLMEMGVTSGTLVEIERIAPMGDPIEIKIRGYHLSLRKEQARLITVELL